MSEPPGSSTTATFTNNQMSNLYWCDQCRNAVRITSPRIQCPECNNLVLTPLRNPEFHYTWSNVDGIRPPRLPPQAVPRRQNYNINNSRSGGSAMTSLLFRPRSQRRLFQSLRNQDTNSAVRLPIRSTTLDFERMAERDRPIIEIDSAAPPIPSTDPAVAVTRSRSNFLRPPGFNPRNFVRGPETNIISSMVTGIIAERALSQQARQQQVLLPQVEAPPEEPASPQSPQVVPQLEASPEEPASPQSPQVVPQLEAPPAEQPEVPQLPLVVPQLEGPPEQPEAPQSSQVAPEPEAAPGPSSLTSTDPIVILGAIAPVIVKPEDVKGLYERSFCGVCFEDFEVGENVIELPCQHRFHDNCLHRYIYLNSGCPDCRYE